MLKWLQSNIPWPSGSSKQPRYDHHILPREKHSISRRDISRSALKVMQRLGDAGYEAYLVGGGVRDLLLNGHPKDFDVATDATPEQVKQVFRNSRIIGRRFRIVHVRFGREIIEVTTFRGHHDNDSSNHHASRSEDGMLLRDNVYGDIRSDALRRDFTINALYYTLNNFSVHDFTNGVQDIARRKIRMIGDPVTRYKEDPVRMLRAVRFAAKLDFDIETNTAAPIQELGPLLGNIPPARLFEECLKLMMGGYGQRVLPLLQDYGLLQYLFPLANAELTRAPDSTEPLYNQALINTDARIRNEQRVTPAFIFAVLLWPAVCREQARLHEEGALPAQAHQQAVQNVLSAQLQVIAIPKRFTQTMKEIWELQQRLPKRLGKRAERMIEHPRFRAAYDFVLLREQAGEDLGGLGQWWTQYQHADTVARQQMVDALGSGKGGKKRRGSRGGGRTRARRQDH